MQDFRLNVRYKNTVTQPRVSDVFSFSIQIKEEAEEIFFGIIIITDFEKNWESRIIEGCLVSVFLFLLLKEQC